MPDQTSPFERALEADMQQLAAEIRERHDQPETKQVGGKELVKEAIRAFPNFEKNPDTGSGAAAAAPSADGAASQSPLPAYADSASPEVKLEIEYLLDVALRQGITKALAASQKSPYFVQDAFHDALAGRLYPELQKRGVVK